MPKLYQPRAAAARRLLPAIAFAFVLSLTTAPALRAQSGRSVAERDTMMRRADAMREMEIKRLESKKDVKADRAPAARISFQQIVEDFRQLQVVNNGMMKAIFSNGAARAPDLDHISKAMAEITRRASRLRTNLQFPGLKGEVSRQSEREIADVKQLKASLLALDKMIMGFVNNPALRESGVLDAQQSAKAKGDLSVIIRLSQRIKERAEKLKN